MKSYQGYLLAANPLGYSLPQINYVSYSVPLFLPFAAGIEAMRDPENTYKQSFRILLTPLAYFHVGKGAHQDFVVTEITRQRLLRCSTTVRPVHNLFCWRGSAICLKCEDMALVKAEKPRCFFSFGSIFK